MLKHRIIPIILTNGIQAVKTKQFKRPGRNVGHMMQHIENMESRNIDELMIFNIGNTDNWRINSKLESYTKNLYCPLTYGGGIMSLWDIECALNLGADKVAINRGAIKKNFINEAARKFGSQCITVAINVNSKDCDNWCRWTVLDYAKFVEDQGAGEILLTYIPNEGMHCGYNYPLIRKVSEQVVIPIIANGGCSEPYDMVLAIQAGAQAVAASSMFLFTEYTPRDCAEFLDKHSIPVRLENKIKN